MKKKRLIQAVIALFMAGVAVEEGRHFLTFARKRHWKLITTASATIVAGYIAYEAAKGEWPWEI